MRMNKLLLGGIIILVSDVVWYFYKKFYSRVNRDVRELKANIAEVMFFAIESRSCRVHAVGDRICEKAACPVRYMRKLGSYINQAGRSLDVCMYMITTELLIKAIVNAHKRGVLVRVILDGHAAENRTSDVAAFHSNGIDVKLVRVDSMMHHKFLIVDREVIITGSMNWTMSGFFGNWENLIVSNENWLVTPFVDEFDRLWRSTSLETSASTDNDL